MTRKQRRLGLIGTAGLVLAAAVGLVLFALNDEIVFFYSPSDLAAKAIEPGTRVRIGGLVEEGSVERGADGQVAFTVTDTSNVVRVAYRGLLPDLFREGQGIIAEGIVSTDGHVDADSVLAKHDENYMPREVADALKEQGTWQGDAAGGVQ